MDEACLWWKIAPAIQIPKYPPILTKFFFHPKCRWHSCVFFFKIQIHHKSQIVSKHIDGPPCSCKDGVPSASRLWGMCWATSQASQKWRLAASTSHPLANWLLNFEEANIDESGTWNKLRCFTKKKKHKPILMECRSKPESATIIKYQLFSFMTTSGASACRNTATSGMSSYRSSTREC